MRTPVTPPRFRRVSLWLLAFAFLAPLGCTSRWGRTYPEADPARLWPAMVAAAKDPAYPDWHLVRNNVWVDEANQRIEIERKIERLRDVPPRDPQREERRLLHRIRLVADEQTGEPRVVFFSRHRGIPALAREEAIRYLERVERLGGWEATAPPREDAERASEEIDGSGAPAEAEADGGVEEEPESGVESTRDGKDLYDGR